MPVRNAKWDTDIRFNFGSTVKTNTEIVGTGEAAYVALTQKADSSNNVDFSTPADFTYNPAEIIVSGGNAQLKPATIEDKNWTFGLDSDYTHKDIALTEITGGNGALKGSPISLYAWYHLNEVSGTNVADSSGNSRNGTTVNSPVWAVGKLNNCLQTNGGYINLGNIADFERTQAWSFDGWIKITTTNVINVIFTRNTTSPNRGIQIIVSTNNKLSVYMLNSYSAPTNYAGVETTNTITGNTWFHLAVTYDGSSLVSGIKIYFNAALQSVSTLSDTLTGTTVTGTPAYIAARADMTYKLNGLVDEVAIFTKALSLSEIQYRYNSGSGTENMLAAYSQTNPWIIPKVGFTFTSIITSFVATKTLPANTALKYQVSANNGVTWKYWSSGWLTVTNIDSYAQTSTESEINTNINSLATSGTLLFRIFLDTTDGVSTPLIDNIYVATSASYVIGDYVISMNNDIAPVPVVAWLTFVETVTKPTNTSINYQYSVDSGATYNGVWKTATEIQTLMQAIVTPVKIRFKFQLSTAIITSTPLIDNVLITGRSGYNATGRYESCAYVPNSTDTNGIYLSTVIYDIEIPDGTSVSFLVRHYNHELETGYVVYNSGDNIDYCGNQIQWEVFYTSDGRNTPKVNLVQIWFHTIVGIMQSIDARVVAIPTNPLLTNDARLDHLDADVSSRLSTIGYTAPDNTSIADIKADVENVTYGLSAIKTDTGNIVTSVNTMAVDVALIKKVESKRWKIINNQMIFYDDDNTTPILTFDLKDDLGNPTMSSPFERMPV